MAQFSLQTYTIRRFLKSEKDMDKTLCQLKQMGIQALEAARIDFNINTAKILKKICDKYSIKIGSTQIKLDKITGHFDEIVDIQKLWGCKYVAVSVLPARYLIKKEEGLKAFAAELNRLGERLARNDLQLLFHHHHFEFLKYGDRLGLEILAENTNPKHVGFVLDTYWIQRGGKTPHELIERYKERVKVVHLRDYRLKLSKFDLLPSDCEVGNGNLDFVKIINSALSSNVEYMAIEQNAKDPLKSIKTSVDNIKQLGFERLF